MSEHDDVLEIGSCKTCIYAFSDQLEKGQLHSGLTYYQVPPAQRLTSFQA